MVNNHICNKEEPSIFTLECPTQKVMDILCNKWSLIILYCLSFGTKRHNQLQKQIEGISQKMLTQTLKHLERHGLVARNVYPVIPPKVEYSLTPVGTTLIEPLAYLCHWSEDHITELEAAQELYDRDSEV
ncbi:MAG: winged helix-turn-helix transcriptional regulator [Xenococcaceae cyanobacterium]